jgi:hypothetical protein
MGALDKLDQKQGLAPATPTPSALATLDQMPTQIQAGHPVQNFLLNAMQPAGMIAGGILGSAGGQPGSMLGSSLGAGGAEAFRQIAARALGRGGPATGEDAYKMISDAADKGALFDLAGIPIGAGMKALAPGVMRAAILPGKAIRMAFKDVGQQALDEGVLPSKMVGAGKATSALRKASSAAEDNLLDEAHEKGVRWSLDNMVDPLRSQAESYLKRPMTDTEVGVLRTQVAGVIRQALGKRAFGAADIDVGTINPSQMKIIKQYAQKKSEAFFEAEQKGTVAAGDPDLHLAIAKMAKDNLQNITLPSDQFPSQSIGGVLKQQFARTQDLIGLNRAVRSREYDTGVERALRYGARGGPALAGAAIGGLAGGSPSERLAHGAMGAAAGATLASPLMLGLLAHGLNNPVAQLLMSQIPKVGAGFLPTTSDATAAQR